MCSIIKPRRLGCRINMPRIGLGTWMLDKSQKSEDTIYRALELGYRHLDSAYNYGNEESIGRVLKRWFEAGNERDDLFITSKLPPFGLRKEEVDKYLCETLEKLGTPYIDLYLIHTPFGFFPTKKIVQDPDRKGSLTWSTDDSTNAQIKWDLKTDHVSIWKEMERQVKEKKRIRHIGVSNFNIRQIEKIMQNCCIRPAVLQVEMHPFLQQKKLSCYCRCNDIVLVAYAPLSSAGNEVSSKYESPLTHPAVLKVAKEMGVSAGQVVLSFVMHIGAIPIPKSHTEEHMIQNLRAADLELNSRQLRELSEMDKGEKGRVFHFRQWKDIMKHPEYPFKIPKEFLEGTKKPQRCPLPNTRCNKK